MNFIKILGLAGFGIFAVGIVEYVKTSIELGKLSAKTKGWMKGYLAGNKEFADKLKAEDPELFAKIESW